MFDLKTLISQIITIMATCCAIRDGVRLHKQVQLIEALMTTASAHGYNGLIVELL